MPYGVALAQPVIYKDTATLITGTWAAPNNSPESAVLTQVNTDAPYEGNWHYRFTYSFQNWWAGCGLNMDNWGSSPARDFSGYSHLRIAYRGLSSGQQLAIRLRNGSNFGPEVVVGSQTGAYTVADIAMAALTANGQVNANAVREINLSILTPTQSGGGTVFFDAIELVNLSGGGGGGGGGPVPASATTMARAAVLGAGVNTSNWLEAYWLIPYNAFPEVNRYNRSKVQALRDAGFVTFRLPVIFERLGDPNPPYTLNTNHIAFSLVDSMIAWAAEMDFRLIIDNHHGLPLTNANYLSQIPRLQAVWTQLANRYGNLDPERYFFEVYNEPENDISNANWRTVAQAVVQTIRQHESATHSILIGANQWNNGTALLNFTPLSDSNIIYTFHYYDPYFFTHQGMSWTSPPYFPPRTFPLAGEMDELNNLFASLKNWADSWQVPVNMGEFGVATSADAASRCSWVQAVMNAANLHSFSYFYWDAISPTDAFGFYAGGNINEASCIPCFKTALGLYQAPAAVELLSFDTQCQGERALLQWTAFSDHPQDRMELQRSTDGVRWHTIYALPAKLGQHTYAYADPAPPAQALYRLRSLSADGEARISPVRATACKPVPQLWAYPNPAADKLNVRLENSGFTALSMHDVQGRLAWQAIYTPAISQTELPVHTLAPGLYWLRVRTADGQTLHRKVAVGW